MIRADIDIGNNLTGGGSGTILNHLMSTRNHRQRKYLGGASGVAIEVLRALTFVGREGEGIICPLCCTKKHYFFSVSLSLSFFPLVYFPFFPSSFFPSLSAASITPAHRK